MSMSSKAATMGEIQMMYVPHFLYYRSLKNKRQAANHSEASKPGERGIKEEEKGRRQAGRGKRLLRSSRKPWECQPKENTGEL